MHATPAWSQTCNIFISCRFGYICLNRVAYVSFDALMLNGAKIHSKLAVIHLYIIAHIAFEHVKSSFRALHRYSTDPCCRIHLAIAKCFERLTIRNIDTFLVVHTSLAQSLCHEVGKYLNLIALLLGFYQKVRFKPKILWIPKPYASPKFSPHDPP